MHRADYRPTKDSQFWGNPLIEALPEQKEYRDFLKWAFQKPRYAPSERELDSLTRINRAAAFKYNFFVPFGKHYQIYLNLYSCLLNSYNCRNPATKEYTEYLASDYRELTSDNFGHRFELYNTPFGFSLIGLSGVGKTSAINQCLKSLPPVLLHDIAGQSTFYQIPYLRVECPREGSLKQLCGKFFESIDRVLNTDYSNRYSGRHFGLDELVSKMAKLALLHHVGCLIVDELQVLSEAKSLGIKRLLNFFVSLNNSIKIPIVLIGIPTSLEFLQMNLRQARRSGESGAFFWDRVANDREWEFFIKVMWKYQWTKHEFPFTTEFCEAMYYYSQGIIDYAVRLFIRAQIRAIVTNAEIVTVDIIQQVTIDEISMERPMLDILRSNDEKAKRIFDDIYFPFDYTAQPLQIHKQDSSSIKLLNIITELKQFNLDESTATHYAELYLEKFPDDDTSKLVVKILLAIKENNKFNVTATVRQSKGKPRKKHYTKDDLRLNKDDNKQNEDLHKELKEKGMIKDPIKDFMDEK
jgi:GTPase SAR1 family protein